MEQKYIEEVRTPRRPATDRSRPRTQGLHAQAVPIHGPWVPHVHGLLGPRQYLGRHEGRHRRALLAPLGAAALYILWIPVPVGGCSPGGSNPAGPSAERLAHVAHLPTAVPVDHVRSGHHRERHPGSGGHQHRPPHAVRTAHLAGRAHHHLRHFHHHGHQLFRGTRARGLLCPRAQHHVRLLLGRPGRNNA